MNIYSKLDQFIKSAKFVLEMRDFQKQAAPPIGGVRYDPNLGLRNASSFQRNVNLNPPGPKIHYSGPSLTQQQRMGNRNQQRQNANIETNSRGFQTWKQLVQTAKTPEHLQKMVETAPQLIGNMSNWQNRMNTGIRRALERINQANGTNYTWDGANFDFGDPSVSGSKPTMSAPPVSTSTTGSGTFSRTASTPASSPIARPTAAASTSSAPPSKRKKPFYVPFDTEEYNSTIFDGAKHNYSRVKDIYASYARSGDVDLGIVAADLASQVYSDVFNAVRKYQGNINSWEQALELAGIPTNDPLGQQVLKLCQRNALPPTETVQQAEQMSKAMGQLVHPYFSTGTQQPQAAQQVNQAQQWQPASPKPNTGTVSPRSTVTSTSAKGNTLQWGKPQVTQNSGSQAPQQQNPWTRSKDGKTLVFSGNTPEEKIQSIMAYNENFKTNILPKLKERWPNMPEAEKQKWRQQIAYTKKYINDALSSLRQEQMKASQSPMGATAGSAAASGSPAGRMFNRTRTANMPNI